MRASSSRGYAYSKFCWNVWKILYTPTHPNVASREVLSYLLYCRPQRSWGKFMLLHVSVILFTGGGVCPSACWDTPPRTRGRPPQARHPPGQTSPRADTPSAQCMLGYDQQAGGTHPTGMQSCWNIFSLGKRFILHFDYFCLSPMLHFWIL